MKDYYKILKKQGLTDEEIAESFILPSEKNEKNDKEFSQYLKATRTMKLTSENVRSIILDCLFEDGVDTSSAVVVEGVHLKMGFDPVKLQKHEEEIRSLLLQLPIQFRLGEGDGWSFLQATDDIHGNNWAEHSNVDDLLCLAIAVGRAKILLPRDMWKHFPGGLPYFSIDISTLKEMRKKKIDKIEGSGESTA